MLHASALCQCGGDGFERPAGLCTGCSPGTYSAATGELIESSDLRSLLPERLRMAGASACTLCVAGTYSPPGSLEISGDSCHTALNRIYQDRYTPINGFKSYGDATSRYNISIFASYDPTADWSFWIVGSLSATGEPIVNAQSDVVAYAVGKCPTLDMCTPWSVISWEDSCGVAHWNIKNLKAGMSPSHSTHGGIQAGMGSLPNLCVRIQAVPAARREHTLPPLVSSHCQKAATESERLGCILLQERALACSA